MKGEEGRGGLGPTRDAAYVFVLTIWRPTLERGVSSVVLVIGTLSRLPHVAAGHRGENAAGIPHLSAAPSDISFRGTPQRLRREGGWVSSAWRARLLFWAEGVRMTIAEGSSSLSDDSLQVAEEGIRGMINATAGATITSYVMIEAAWHILAAWVASGQTKSTAAERFCPRIVPFHVSPGGP